MKNFILVCAAFVAAVVTGSAVADCGYSYSYAVAAPPACATYAVQPTLPVQAYQLANYGYTPLAVPVQVNYDPVVVELPRVAVYQAPSAGYAAVPVNLGAAYGAVAVNSYGYNQVSAFRFNAGYGRNVNLNVGHGHNAAVNVAVGNGRRNNAVNVNVGNGFGNGNVNVRVNNRATPIRNLLGIGRAQTTVEIRR